MSSYSFQCLTKLHTHACIQYNINQTPANINNKNQLPCMEMRVLKHSIFKRKFMQFVLCRQHKLFLVSLLHVHDLLQKHIGESYIRKNGYGNGRT